MNKKKMILVAILALLALLIVSGVIYYRSAPKETVQKFLEKDDFQDLITEEFSKKLKDERESSSVSSSAYEYEENNYINSSEVEAIEITDRQTGQVHVKIQVVSKTIHKKTGFTTTTDETYEATLIQDGLTWKINDYELLESTTRK
jgi:uncharacterized protein YxeA